MFKLSMEVSDYYSSKDHFIVEELFSFEAGVDGGEDNGVFDAVNGNSTEFSNVDGGNGHNFLNSGYGQHFSADFCQPCEEVAELEWLSNFMEECFSNKDINPKPQFSHTNSSSSSIQTQVSSPLTSSPTLNPVPAPKTRSKRSRAKPTNWSSQLPILSPPPTPSPSSDSVLGERKARNPMRCLHCGSDKTPQWRMGPMGPKTLCNACGVRYKSGRLVPEYRPAASPSFVVSEHSNSHRKVVELRRQKEMQKQKHQQQMLFWS